MNGTCNNVILFGAGASVDAGIPLLGNFLDTIWRYAKRGKSDTTPLKSEDRDVFERAIAVRDELNSYNSRASFDDENIEDILSLLSFEALTGDSMAEKYEAFVKAIARTIELSCSIHYSRTLPPEPFQNAPYRGFWHTILDPKLREANLALMTFNYDLVLERALCSYFHADGHVAPATHVRNCGLKYSFRPYDHIVHGEHINGGNRQSTRVRFAWEGKSEVEIPYFKLHGSLNWDRRFVGSQAETGDRLQPNLEPMNMADEPLILPPVFNKNSSLLRTVWADALTALRTARHIIIVGYSLPRTDIYMQYFLKAAVGPNSNLRKVIVFDPTLFRSGPEADAMKSRYSDCFSDNLCRKISFNPPKGNENPGTFKHFLELLRSTSANLLFLP